MNAVGRINGHGTPESEWQRWFRSAQLHLRPWTEWIPSIARLVVIAPHPDDEILACGALLWKHGTRAGKTLVIAITDGEASHGVRFNGTRGSLAAVRRNERMQGLTILGLTHSAVVSLGLPDGQVGQRVELVEAKLSRLLQPTDIVVSTWRFDGHPDHEATGLAAARACATLGCCLLEAPVWMWHWASPGDPRVPWHRLQGVPLAPPDVIRKQAALAAHVSQLTQRSEHLGPVLDADILARSRRNAEFFFV